MQQMSIWPLHIVSLRRGEHPNIEPCMLNWMSAWAVNSPGMLSGNQTFPDV